ncbi:hypothetical protein E2C01_041110 [Portunus trituberculatus]|uniref:Uncharacterized protein n=1 Tax=Portunus trituberculatus TaxID=210409 RepID=A0A5B7FPI2_PORTR|nr:hypothetical protein [Portunus trituberculatus]
MVSLHRIPRPRSPQGWKKGTSLVAIPRQEQKTRIFISRMSPHINVNQIQNIVGEFVDVQPEVEQIKTRNDTYASFLVQEPDRPALPRFPAP